MNVLVLMFGGFGLFAVGAIRVLRGPVNADETNADAAAQGAAFIGLAVILVIALAWFPLALSGLFVLAVPVPYLLGAYSLSCARKPLTAVVAALDYSAPLAVAWLLSGRSL
jgi:hypothetical protein